MKTTPAPWLESASHDAPAYTPPFESPIEHEFAWAVVKYLGEECRFEKQVSFETFAGTFRLDFVATSPGGRRVGLECDGRQYHNLLRDQCRDAVLLWTDCVDVVYRIRGTDIINRLEDALAIIAGHEPIFSGHGRLCLERLASFPAREKIGQMFERGMSVDYPPTEYDPLERQLILWRHSRWVRERPGRCYLRDFYDFAVEHPGRLDSIIEAWLEREK
jgi:hypothetical protein